MQTATKFNEGEGGVNWMLRPAIPTQPYHHFCSVMERGDVEEKMHSSHIDIVDAGIKMNGVRNKTRLVQVIALGAGRWVPGSGCRQPAEVKADELCYIKERTIPFRFTLRRQYHYFIAMDSIMTALDPVNLKLRPVGQHVVTRAVEERHRVAVMGDMPFHIGTVPGVDKKGEESDDIGCNAHRIEEVVAVGPGKFGGFKSKLRRGDPQRCEDEWVLEQEPYWETPDCAVGDLICFTDLARPTDITLAGKVYTVFEFDHSVCAVLDKAIDFPTAGGQRVERFTHDAVGQKLLVP